MTLRTAIEQYIATPMSQDELRDYCLNCDGYIRAGANRCPYCNVRKPFGSELERQVWKVIESSSFQWAVVPLGVTVILTFTWEPVMWLVTFFWSVLSALLSWF